MTGWGWDFFLFLAGLGLMVGLPFGIMFVSISIADWLDRH